MFLMFAVRVATDTNDGLLAFGTTCCGFGDDDVVVVSVVVVVVSVVVVSVVVVVFVVVVVGEVDSEDEERGGLRPETVAGSLAGCEGDTASSAIAARNSVQSRWCVHDDYDADKPSTERAALTSTTCVD
jgi:hypothetical protein